MKRLQASTALARGRAKRRHYDQAFKRHRKRHLKAVFRLPG
jgi:hypothetical protein